MSLAEDNERSGEIIIVRRGGGDEEDGHHGGAWKIAFADFMTAMMCFFLVMWLVNASTEQTKAALASYFNPVKLVDSSTGSKGIEEIGTVPGEVKQDKSLPQEGESTPSSNRDQSSLPEDADNAVTVPETREFSDESLFADPFSVLAEIASETGRQANISSRGDGGANEAGPSTGASGGESYRDPFAPDFWSQQVAGLEVLEQDEGANPPAERTTEPSQDKAEQVEAGQSSKTTVALAPVPEIEPLKQEEKPAEAEPQKQEAPAAEVAAATPAAPRSEEIAAAMREELARQFEGSPLAGSVTVVAAEENVVISITDDLEHGMFPVGSAVPDRELVLAMDKIGQVLANQQGAVKISGHTDGRPFRSATYDNWRLSSARAQAAYYMLVRGGLDEKRINQVAGYADRKLKVPEDPYASANRRIEILLELPR